MVVHQLGGYLDRHCMHHPCQSAYRQNHSVETSLIKVHNNIMLSVDWQESVVLLMLDMSAAFDTVDHVILLCRIGLEGVE